MAKSYTYAQAPSTQGTEFYISFMQNGYRYCNGGTAYDDLLCIISAKDACSGTVSNPNTGWNTSFYVAANGITTLSIPVGQAYSSVSEIVENKGLILSSTDTVSLYIANEATNSFDASNVLPTESLGDEHIIQCYSPSVTGLAGSACIPNLRSAFLIIATENNTVVDIIPSCTTEANNPPNYNYSISLNKGQTYLVKSRGNGTSGNLSGSFVKARECKKIAVFNGDVLTGVPASPTNGFDHIFEQAIPVMYWGNKFAITASEARKGDFYRVTASANNTQIRINGILVAVINQYATYENFLSDTSCYLETSKPAAVYLYQTTSEYDQSADGDPSMVWITPIEQQIKEITFGTFTAHNTINHHYVNIVSATNNIYSITLDNVYIANRFLPLKGNAALSYARIEIQHGTHTIKGSSGFTAFVYGFGAVRGYAYSVGSNAIDLTGNIVVNNVDDLEGNMDDSKKYCLNDTLLFKLKLNYEYDSISWNMGNGTSTYHTVDSIFSSYSIPGYYLIRAVVKLDFANCEGNFYDTVQGYIHVIEIKDTIRDTTCYGYYNRNGFDFHVTHDTVASLKTSSWMGCDSVVMLYLHVLENPSFEDTVICCPNSDAVWRNKKLQTSVSGQFTVWDSLTAVNGCDSLYRLTLIVLPVYLIVDTVTVCHQTPATSWRNQLLSASALGTFIFWDSLKTYHYQCDSIYKLVFTVLPVPEMTPILQDDTLCPRTETEMIEFTGTATYYEWFASGDNIGVPTQIQRGNFEKYTVVNNTGVVASATITVTPKSDYGHVVCIGLFDQFTVSVYPDVVVDAIANDSLFCEGGNILFEVINSHELQNIQWNGPDGFSSSVPSPDISDAALKHSGMYTVDAVTQYECDAVTDTLMIVIIPDIVLDMKDTFFVCNSEIMIPSSAMYAEEYLWSTGDTTADIVASHVGTYWVRTNNRRCQASDTVYVVETNIPPFEIETKRDMCEEGSMELYIEIGIENLYCKWSTGDTGKCTTVSQNGIYGVAVSLTGCTVLQQLEVECPCYLWIPNTFTPNGDNVNDHFLPLPNAVLDRFSMYIYDRWGSLIYKTDTYSSWDGTANGTAAMMDVYTYLISYCCASSPDKTRKAQGKISLIR
jgi:gliding motility-associated-like protein